MIFIKNSQECDVDKNITNGTISAVIRGGIYHEKTNDDSVECNDDPDDRMLKHSNR